MTPSAFFLFRFFFRSSKKNEKKNSTLTSPFSKLKLSPSQQEKNVSSDLLDGRVGRVYVPRQDLAELPSAVMKGAKRERREGKEGGGGEEKKSKKKTRAVREVEGEEE